jgi:solute carrier family 25 (mitochondrial carnitine/acylcarnitine transporter), member 20/29
LFNGVKPILFGSLLSGICFSAYENTFLYFKKVNPNQNDLFNSFYAGVMIGIINSTITTPAELIKTQLQIKNTSTGTIEQIRKIKAQNGFLGLFSGYSITTIRETIGYGVYFSLYRYLTINLKWGSSDWGIFHAGINKK